MSSRINQGPNLEPRDGCDCLSDLQAALVKIPSFCHEAEDNCGLRRWHKLHMYATTGETAAFNSLLGRIVDEYAELRHSQQMNEGMTCCEARAYLVKLWEGVQQDEEHADD